MAVVEHPTTSRVSQADPQVVDMCARGGLDHRPRREHGHSIPRCRSARYCTMILPDDVDDAVILAHELEMKRLEDELRATNVLTTAQLHKLRDAIEIVGRALWLAPHLWAAFPNEAWTSIQAPGERETHNRQPRAFRNDDLEPAFELLYDSGSVDFKTWLVYLQLAFLSAVVGCLPLTPEVNVGNKRTQAGPAVEGHTRRWNFEYDVLASILAFAAPCLKRLVHLKARTSCRFARRKGEYRMTNYKKSVREDAVEL